LDEDIGYLNESDPNFWKQLLAGNSNFNPSQFASARRLGRRAGFDLGALGNYLSQVRKPTDTGSSMLTGLLASPEHRGYD